MRRGGKSVYGRNEDLLVQLCVTCIHELSMHVCSCTLYI